MRRKTGVMSVAASVVRKAPWLSLMLLLSAAGAIVFALFPPLVLEQIVDRLTGKDGRLLGAALLYFGMLAAAGLFDAAKEVMITRFGQKVTHELRHRMCAKLSRLQADYFIRNEAGKITSRFVNDGDAVDSLFTNGIISMFVDACKVISIIAVIFSKSLGLGLIMLAVTPLLLYMTRLIQKRMLKAQMENRTAIETINNHVPETIRCIRMIRSLFRQSYMERRYDDYIQESYRAVEKSNFYDSIYSPIIVFISTLIVAAVMVLASMGGGMQSFFGMTVGTAVAVIAYVGKVFEPLEHIGMEIQNIQSAVAGCRRVGEFLREVERPETDASFRTADMASDGECIRFDNVSFGYDAAVPVLKGLTFAVRQGETVTLMGRTGVGKSTAFRLLLGLYSADSGQVTVYGRTAGSIPDTEKRQLFGYVEQTFRLVAGTVAEQISLFDDGISRERIEQAAKLVGLHESILALENGYDTQAREGLFSHGQFQLLSIARAVAANPAIMLLDEITASLDSDTERRVLEALERVSGGRTVLSISHRLYERTARGRLIEF